MNRSYLLEDAGSLGAYTSGNNLNSTSQANDLDSSEYNKTDDILSKDIDIHSNELDESEDNVMSFLGNNGLPESDQHTVLDYLQAIASIDGDELSDLKPQEIKSITVEFINSQLGYEPVQIDSLAGILGENLTRKLIEQKEIVEIFDIFYVRL